jgi:RNA polymerase sigma factor (sigma-70 family)
MRASVIRQAYCERPPEHVFDIGNDGIMNEHNGYTTRLNELLDRWNAGDSSAIDDIIMHSQERLRRMASRMLADKPHVGRWSQTDDVLQNALVRLHRSLKDVKPDSKRAFNGLAAQQMRRELCDMARSLYGPLGHGRHHETDAGQASPDENERPKYVAVAAETDSIDSFDMVAFHESVDRLDAEEKEVFELIFYQGMTQVEVAHLLDVSDRTIKRRFRAAKLSLNSLLNSDPNEENLTSE